MAAKQFIFISGLPRAGSTLLCNILAQNPAFHVSRATSGLCDVLFSIRNQYDQLIEHQAEAGGPDYDRLRRILIAVTNAYHDTDKPIVMDKSRGWLSLLELADFTGLPYKVIVPVRNIAEILASMERLYRKTAGQTQWQFEKQDYFLAQTVTGRCEIWSRRDQLVGLAYNRLRDALQREHGGSIHLVEFDELTRRPAVTIAGIYDFLNLADYAHDLDNVEQYTAEDDAGVHRIPNLHTIRPKIEPVPHVAQKILGELASKYRGVEFWRS